MRRLSLHSLCARGAAARAFFKGFPGFNSNDVFDRAQLQRDETEQRLREARAADLMSSEAFSLSSRTSCPRSILFVPCSNAKALKKIATLNADAFILDLEDSVAPSQKAAARDNLINFLLSGDAPQGKRFVVRINSPRENPEHGFVDLDAVGTIGEKVEGVAVPKTTQADYGLIENSLHPEHVLWAFFETPEGVLDAQMVLKDGHYKFACMGLNDFCAEMDIPLSLTSAAKMSISNTASDSSSSSSSGGVALPPRRWPLHTAMSMVAMAARAYDVHPIDGVYNDPTDHDGLRAELYEARMLGFAGKTLIHPSQIDPTNAAFTPTEREVEWARKVVEAVRGSAGGVAVVDGKMVEDLHARQAIKIIQRAGKGRDVEARPAASAAPAGASAENTAGSEGVADPSNASSSSPAVHEGEAAAAAEAARKQERRERMVAGKRRARDDVENAGAPRIFDEIFEKPPKQ